MASVSQITTNFPRSHFVPDKSRGQNFLIDKNVLSKIVAAAELKPSDTVVEIGAGTGILTAELAKRAGQVAAFEVDKKLIPVLQKNLKDFYNIEIINNDILKSLKSLKDYKIVANIPYNITSAVLEKFLSAQNKPTLMVLLVQREVAERVCAKPGEMSILSVTVQYYGEPEIVAVVPPVAFWPRPKVESAILKINVGANGRSPVSINEKFFFQAIKAGFSRRRKMLKNALKSLNSLSIKLSEKEIVEILAKTGLSPSVRAQELSIREWVKLASCFFGPNC